MQNFIVVCNRLWPKCWRNRSHMSPSGGESL